MNKKDREKLKIILQELNHIIGDMIQCGNGHFREEYSIEAIREIIFGLLSKKFRLSKPLWNNGKTSELLKEEEKRRIMFGFKLLDIRRKYHHADEIKNDSEKVGNLFDP